MKSKWIMHNNKNILFVDCSLFQLDTAALEAEVSAVVRLLLNEPADSVLIVVDVSHTVGSIAALECFKCAGVKTKNIIHKAAVLGITEEKLKLMKAIIAFSGIKIVPFEDLEAAKNWLTQE